MFGQIKNILYKAIEIWNEEQVNASAAAFAFFAVLSLAPTLVFATAVATRWLGEETTQELIIERLDEFGGTEFSELAQTVLDSPWYEKFSEQSLIASLPSAFLLLYGSSSVFIQLRRALQEIFGKPAAAGKKVALAWLLSRLVGTAGAIFGGLFFIASLLGSFVLRVASSWLSDTVGISESVWNFASIPATLIVFFVLFLAAFTGLSQSRPPLRYLVLGASVSSIGFEIGRWAFEAYVSHSFVATAYGPASSIVAFLLWMYYTANVVLLGAVIAQSAWCESRKKLEEPQTKRDNYP